MIRAEYVTDERGRAGRYVAREVSPVAAMASPRCVAGAAGAGWEAVERDGVLHLVSRATGESFGILASAKVGKEQAAALERMGV